MTRVFKAGETYFCESGQEWTLEEVTDNHSYMSHFPPDRENYLFGRSNTGSWNRYNLNGKSVNRSGRLDGDGLYDLLTKEEKERKDKMEKAEAVTLEIGKIYLAKDGLRRLFTFRVVDLEGGYSQYPVTIVELESGQRWNVTKQGSYYTSLKTIREITPASPTSFDAGLEVGKKYEIFEHIYSHTFVGECVGERNNSFVMSWIDAPIGGGSHALFDSKGNSAFGHFRVVKEKVNA